MYSHISNNILLAENSGTTEIYNFYWDDVEHLLIQNNVYWSIDGAAGIVLSEGNTVLGPDNRIINPYLSDPSSQDYSFSEQSPYALTRGGMDLSDYFTIDLNGNSRSVPWSMGAYEGR